MNKKVMESLIKAGAFDFTGEERPALFARIGQVVASSQAATKDRASGQTSLFDTLEITSAAPEPMDHEPVEQWTKDEMLAFEKELLGFYVTGHPLDSYRNTILSKASVRSYLDLEELPTGKDKKQNFIAFVSSATIKYTKAKGLPFAILITEDLYASAEVLVWNDVFEKTDRALLSTGAVIKLQAAIEVDSRTESRRLVASSIFPCRIDPNAQPIKKKLERYQTASGRGGEISVAQIDCGDALSHQRPYHGQ